MEETDPPSNSKEGEPPVSCNAPSSSLGTLISSSSPTLQSSLSAAVPSILSNTATSLGTSAPSVKCYFVSSDAAARFQSALLFDRNFNSSGNSAASEASCSTQTPSPLPFPLFANAQGFSSFSPLNRPLGALFSNLNSESCSASSSPSLFSQRLAFGFGNFPEPSLATKSRIETSAPFAVPFLNQQSSSMPAASKIHVPFPSRLPPEVAKSSTSNSTTSIFCPMISSSETSACIQGQLSVPTTATLRNTEAHTATQTKNQKRNQGGFIKGKLSDKEKTKSPEERPMKFQKQNDSFSHKVQKVLQNANNIVNTESATCISDGNPKVAKNSSEADQKPFGSLDLLTKLHELEKRDLEYKMHDTKCKLKFTHTKLLELENMMSREIKGLLNVIDFKDNVLEGAGNSMYVMRKSHIVWPNLASEVLLVGSFDSWRTQWKMERTAVGIFVLVLLLYPGKYQVKFIVDGALKIDPQRPIVFNNGSENNLLIIN